MAKHQPQSFKNAPTYNDPVKGGYDLMPVFGVDELCPELTGLLIRPYYSFDEIKATLISELQHPGRHSLIISATFTKPVLHSPTASV